MSAFTPLAIGIRLTKGIIAKNANGCQRKTVRLNLENLVSVVPNNGMLSIFANALFNNGNNSPKIDIVAKENTRNTVLGGNLLTCIFSETPKKWHPVKIAIAVTAIIANHFIALRDVIAFLISVYDSPRYAQNV